jgi:hypothetical protein
MGWDGRGGCDITHCFGAILLFFRTIQRLEDFKTGYGEEYLHRDEMDKLLNDEVHILAL